MALDCKKYRVECGSLDKLCGEQHFILYLGPEIYFFACSHSFVKNENPTRKLRRINKLVSSDDCVSHETWSYEQPVCPFCYCDKLQRCCSALLVERLPLLPRELTRLNLISLPLLSAPALNATRVGRLVLKKGRRLKFWMGNHGLEIGENEATYLSKGWQETWK